MKLSAGRIALWLFLLLVVLAIAAFTVPEINAEPVRAPLALALQRTLGRPVEFGEIHYQLLPLPGVTVANLVIPEDPDFGLEPVAYVSEMQVTLAWQSLFLRRIEVSSVQLGDASLNVALHPERGWNVVQLLRQMSSSVRASGRMPSVTLSACRVNFRTGTRKSAYFLNNVDLDLDAEDAGRGGLSWAFEASPARTDRAEQGFGRFTGEGRWRPSRGDGALDVEVDLEPSAISEVTQFLAGRDLGLQGRLASRARITGTSRSLKLRGRVELAEIDRPALLGLRQTELGLAFEGELDLPGQRMSLQTGAPTKGPTPPVAVEFLATSIFLQPSWRVRAFLDGLPAAAFLDFAEKLGTTMPQGLSVIGGLSGHVNLSAGSGLDGELKLAGAEVRLGQAGPLKMDSARVKMQGAVVALEDATVRTENSNEAVIRGRWSATSEELEFNVRTGKLSLDELLVASSSIPGLPPLPLLQDCRGGQVQGAIEFKRSGATAMPAGFWTGDLATSGMRCPIQGAAEPILIERGRVTFGRNQWSARRVQGRWGGADVEGDAVFQPAALRPLHFNLIIDNIAWPELERLMEPSLARRRSFLERTLPFRRSTQPVWLAGRKAEGMILIKSLLLGGDVIQGISGRLFWDGANFEIPQLAGQFREARLDGRLQIALSPDAPAYRFLGGMRGLAWQGGSAEVDIDLRTRGLHAAVVTNLQASGSFRALRASVDGEPYGLLAGDYDFDASRRPGRLRLSAVEVRDLNGEIMVGSGISSPDGSVTLDLVSPRRNMRVSGSLNPFRLGQPAAETSRAR